MFIKTICHAEQEWRNGSTKSCHTQPGEMTPGMNGSRPPRLHSVASGAGTHRHQPPGALAGPRKTTLPKPQSQATQSQSLFCSYNCLSNRSQLKIATEGMMARESHCWAFVGVTTRATPGGPPCRQGQSQACPGRTERACREAQHKRSWKKFNKSCFIFSGGPYWLLSNLFHPQSLFFGKTEKREGRWV